MNKIPKEIVLVPNIGFQLQIPAEYDEEFKDNLIKAFNILLEKKDYLGSYLKIKEVLASKELSIFEVPFMRSLLPIYMKKLVPDMHTYMLNDKSRNDSFHKAISKALKNKDKKVILDIGSGSGILAMMCADAGEGNEEIVACEVNPLVADLCEMVLKENDMLKKVSLVKKKSSFLEIGEDITEKADILITETIADNVISEGIINTVNHAHDNLLKDGATLIPKRASLRAFLVENELSLIHI